MGTECPFCRPAAEQVFYVGELVLGLWDAFPVSEGHALLVTRRHVGNWFEATPAERAELAEATTTARHAILKRIQGVDFNLGVNIGAAAGQTVPHLHLHLIPRLPGDVPDPRGGVRHVIPAKGNYLIGATSPPQSQDAAPAYFLTTGPERPLLPALTADLANATQLDLAVAFVMRSGVNKVFDRLWELLDRGGSLRVLTGDYLDVTDPDGLQMLLDLALAHPHAVVELRVFESAGTSFHPKAFIVRSGTLGGVAYVGSSNLSQSALEDGVEWNYRVIRERDDKGYQQVAAAFERLLHHPATRVLTEEWLAAYRARRSTRVSVPQVDEDVEPQLPPPAPNEVQKEALEALEATRLEGYTAGLVVMATGLGKTWLAAFDTDRPEFRRVLFVAHREEILGQAIKNFRRARPEASFGFYNGTEKALDADVTFGSIQTLGRKAHLEAFDPSYFDYIVVDEFHHAAAGTYRRLIQYFRPKFLLGLTATPERTDGGDLLGLCQENLVFRKDLPEGIRLGLLSPFMYFGVPDDIDYENIPWRSAHFDEELLTKAVATSARAGNALEQWRKLGGGRTLAFCVSQRHADFMRDFAREKGLRAASVHSGETSDPRAASLERLAAGQLDMVFAVDIFNEGVDIPAIETVMMLRPTESQILWLQQLGRGLRWQEGKKLKVIDYIGNHRIFLVKVRTLLQLGPVSDSAIAAALEKLARGEWELPPGCEATYELRAVEILRGLLRTGGTESALKEYYLDYRERLGGRPTALEAFHDNYSPRSMHATHGSWLEFVEAMGDLDEAEKRALNAGRSQFREFEKTRMVKSYKMLVALALLDAGALPGEGLHVDQLVQRVRELASRNPRIATDLGTALQSEKALRRLLVDNPIEAWVGGKGREDQPIFSFEGEVLRFVLEVPTEERACSAELFRELAEWRLAEYLESSRANATPSGFTMSASQASGRPMLFLPERKTHPQVPTGWQKVVVDGREYQANFVKVALNVVRLTEDGENELPTLMRTWFGPKAGHSGTRHEVVAEPAKGGGWSLSPKLARATPALIPWTSYAREQIPTMFGEKFSDAVWNNGFVVRPSETPKHIFLLVTLNKGQMLDGHQYADRFLSPERFQWQSQNRTTQDSKHGRLIRDHDREGVEVHLFVRPEKKGPKNATMGFIYCGRVQFESWRKEKPITVVWKLDGPVPERLHGFFGI